MPRILLCALVALLCISSAYAQTVPQPVQLSWVLPIQNTDGSAISATGPDALSRVEIFLSLAPLDTSNPGTAFAVLTPTSTSASQSFPAAYGSVVYARIRVQNNAGVYSDFTPELQIQTAHKPGVPTNFTFTLQPNGTVAVTTP